LPRLSLGRAKKKTDPKDRRRRNSYRGSASKRNERNAKGRPLGRKHGALETRPNWQKPEKDAGGREKLVVTILMHLAKKNARGKSDLARETWSRGQLRKGVQRKRPRRTRSQKKTIQKEEVNISEKTGLGIH